MLIETKLRRPRLPDAVIERESALTALDPSLGHVLTVVSAPPGFGKTTLVSHWVERRQVPHAWLSLDDHDDDSVSFWRAVCAALGKIEPRFMERVWPRFGPFESVDVTEGIQALVRELTDYSRSWKASRALALILDDFHVITDATVLSQFGYFLDYCPDILHCIVTSRHAPALDLPRRRVRNQLHELGARELRFDLAASERFLTRRLDLRLTPPQLRHLHQKTEGWVAALQLAGLSMAADPSPLKDLPDLTGQHQFLADYLLAEVFSRQSAEIRVFLSEAAVLPRFSPALLDAALGRHDADRVLTTLVDRNLLIYALDARSQWFRFHDLFSEWLRAHQPVPDRVHVIRQQAAQWLEQHGLSFDAADLCIDQQDWTAAANLVQRSLESWLLSGEWFRAERLLARFPAGVIAVSPGLQYLSAMRWFNRGDYAGADRELQRLEDRLATKDGAVVAVSVSLLTGVDSRVALSILCLFLRSHIARYSGNFSEATVLVKRLMTLPEVDGSALNAWIQQGIGIDLFFSGELVGARHHLISSMQIAERHGDIFCLAITLAWLVPTLVHHGELSAAHQWIERMEVRLNPNWREHPLAAQLPNLRAVVLREENRLAAAQQEVVEAISLGMLRFNSIDRVYFAFLRWSLAMGQGDFASAAGQLNEIEAIHASTAVAWPYVIPEVSLLRLIQRLVAGDLNGLRNWARERAFDDFTGARLRVSAEQLLWVRGRLLSGEEVADELQAIRRVAVQGGVRIRELQTWLVEASTYLMRGEMAESQAAMVRALQLSAAHGFTRTVLDEGPHVRLLLQACLVVPGVKHEARRLLDELSGDAPVAAAEPALAEALSKREQELLVLLDTGLSNQAMAEALGISASTIKAHLRNIYGKLGVKNRTQALSAARQHHYLS